MESFPIFEHITVGSIAGLVGFAMMGNLFPGIPEEIAILALGVAVGAHIIPAPLAFVTTLGGLWIVDNLLYYLAHRGSRFVTFIQNKIFAGKIDTQGEFVKTHLYKIIFFSRFIVHVRPIGPLLAGINHVPWKRFAVLNATALSIYIGVMFLIGIYFRSRIERIIYGVGFMKNILLLAIILVIFIIVGRFMYKIFMKKLQQHEEGSLFLQKLGIKKKD